MKKTILILTVLASLPIALWLTHPDKPFDPRSTGSKPVDEVEDTKPVPVAMNPLAVPGYGLPGSYGWEYDAQTGLIRYLWNWYSNGVLYKGCFNRLGFGYSNIYPDHTDAWTYDDGYGYVFDKFEHYPPQIDLGPVAYWWSQWR